MRLILEGPGIDVDFSNNDDHSLYIVGTNEVSDWYGTNLKTNYSQYLVDAGFCRDTDYTTEYNEESGLTVYYSGSYNRIDVIKKPQFACADASYDLLTTTNASFGSKSLTNPVGLISADEVAYAGGSVMNTYLPSGLTLSSRDWSGSNYGSNVYSIDDSGKLTYYDTIYNYQTVQKHPVINLRADIEVTGNGTKTNPYRVLTN